MSVPANDRSNAGQPHQESGVPPDGWTIPRDEVTPRPTYAPLVLAVGVVCMFWGIVTTYLLTLLGLVLFIVGFSGWIGELRHERRHPHAK